jgi:superfamily II DNA or RNA helicase
VIFSHLPQHFPELSAAGTLVLVHRDILVQQAAGAFAVANPLLRIGIEQAEQSAEPEDVDVVIASVQTLSRQQRLNKYKGFGGIIIVDEAHHMKVDNTYDTVLSFFGVGSDPSQLAPVSGGSGGSGGSAQSKTHNRRLLAGFTATPFRTDGAPLMGTFFEKCVSPLDLGWGVSNGYLVDIEVFRVLTAVAVDLKEEEGGGEGTALEGGGEGTALEAASSVAAATALSSSAASAAAAAERSEEDGEESGGLSADEEWGASDRVSTFKRSRKRFGTTA